MPMELYSSEAFVRDIANAISSSEGKPLNFGGNHHQGIDRDYAFQLITEAKMAIEGNFGSSASSPASKATASRSAAIKKFMTKSKRQDAAAKPPRARATKKTPALPARGAAKTSPRTAGSRRTRAAAS